MKKFNASEKKKSQISTLSVKIPNDLRIINEWQFCQVNVSENAIQRYNHIVPRYPAGGSINFTVEKKKGNCLK